MIGRKRGLSSLPRNAHARHAGGCAHSVAVLHCEQGLAHNQSRRGMMAEYPFDGGVLYYEEQGKGDPILFIHGVTMSSRFFARQLDWLARHDYHALALDLARPHHPDLCPGRSRLHRGQGAIVPSSKRPRSSTSPFTNSSKASTDMAPPGTRAVLFFKAAIAARRLCGAPAEEWAIRPAAVSD